MLILLTDIYHEEIILNFVNHVYMCTNRYDVDGLASSSSQLISNSLAIVYRKDIIRLILTLGEFKTYTVVLFLKI